MAYVKRRFVSVFYDLAHEFPAIFRSDEALATWLRLLMTADAMWPAPASIPRNANAHAIALLTHAGLVVVDGDEYVMKGHSKLRTALKQRGEAGAKARWDRNANAYATAHANAMPSTAQHSTRITPLDSNRLDPSVEEENDEERNTKRLDDFTAVAALMEELCHKPYALANPSSKYADMAQAMIDREGMESFEAMARWVAAQLPKQPPQVQEILFGCQRAFTQQVDITEKRKEDRQADDRKRSQRTVEKTQLLLHGYGQHTDPTTFPACPVCRGDVTL